MDTPNQKARSQCALNAAGVGIKSDTPLTAFTRRAGLVGKGGLNPRGSAPFTAFPKT